MNAQQRGERAARWLLVDASYGLSVQKDDANHRVRDDDHARELLYRDARLGDRAAIDALIDLAEDARALRVDAEDRGDLDD